jgi:hypothetical protein
MDWRRRSSDGKRRVERRLCKMKTWCSTRVIKVHRVLFSSPINHLGPILFWTFCMAYLPYTASVALAAAPQCLYPASAFRTHDLNNTMSTPSSSQALATSDLQTEVATALRDFYSFLSLLPWLDPSDILEPPASGWPNINNDNFAPLHKTKVVVELLKHLPYLNMDQCFEKYPFLWSTYACDYRRSYFQPGKLKEGIDCWEIPNTQYRDFDFPEWVVPLTFGKLNGVYVMLDTSDGTYLSKNFLNLVIKTLIYNVSREMELD